MLCCVCMVPLELLWVRAEETFGRRLELGWMLLENGPFGLLSHGAAGGI